MKAIHNPFYNKNAKSMLLSITKVQNLKAIHNKALSLPPISTVVINHKTTKFESNSQLWSVRWTQPHCCYQSQNYKIWKQFTTTNHLLSPRQLLLSITKLQNLKAIHNSRRIKCITVIVVINHKTIKFESNSQHSLVSCCWCTRCYQS